MNDRRESIFPEAEVGSESHLSKQKSLGQERSIKKIQRALVSIQEGKRKKCRALINEVLKDGHVSGAGMVAIHNIALALDDKELAEKIKSQTLLALDQAREEFADASSVILDAGLCYFEFSEIDTGIEAMLQVLAMEPGELKAGFPLISVFLQRKEPERLLKVWRPLIDAVSDEEVNAAILSLVRGLGYFGYKLHALAFAEAGRSRWLGDQMELDRVIEFLRNPSGGEQDLGVLINQMDNFSEFYDANLAAIENQGPLLIAQMAAKLNWKPDGSRHIFDAGCGTGLCGPHLRPFAKVLHGCDISVGMLRKSKERQVYDLLVRTDLGNSITYPDATFTDVICADVLVYFGDLQPVLKNLASVLKPGGWIIFTVEEAIGDTPQGWERYSSGRYRHAPDYVSHVLTKAGFCRPKEEIHNVLRTEFRVPIPGLCVAAQKLAFPIQ